MANKSIRFFLLKTDSGHVDIDTVTWHKNYIFSRIDPVGLVWFFPKLEGCDMASNTMLIYLHDAMARLCKLYMSLEEDSDKGPDREDLILQIKNEIEDIYSEIINMTSERPA